MKIDQNKNKNKTHFAADTWKEAKYCCGKEQKKAQILEEFDGNANPKMEKMGGINCPKNYCLDIMSFHPPSFFFLLTKIKMTNKKRERFGLSEQLPAFFE